MTLITLAVERLCVSIMPRVRRILSTSEVEDVQFQASSQTGQGTFDKMKRYFDKQFEEMRDDLPDKREKRDKDKEFSKQSSKEQDEFDKDQFGLVEKAFNYLTHDNKRRQRAS